MHWVTFYYACVYVFVFDAHHSSVSITEKGFIKTDFFLTTFKKKVTLDFFIPCEKIEQSSLSGNLTVSGVRAKHKKVQTTAYLF